MESRVKNKTDKKQTIKRDILREREREFRISKQKDMNPSSAGLNGSPDNQLQFVCSIENYPVLLEKSNLPEVKRKKAKAIEEIKARLLKEFGIEMSEVQIFKKINNMKSRVINKVKKKPKGNRNILLKGWEEKFFIYMRRDRNLSIARLQGSVSEDGERILEDDQNLMNDSAISVTSHAGSVKEGTSSKLICCSSGSEITSSKLAMTKTSALASSKDGNYSTKLIETDETKGLNTSELKRLVLLEQLQVLRLAKELMLKKRREQKQCDVDENEGNPVLNLFTGLDV